MPFEPHQLAERWLRIRDESIRDDTPFALDDDGFLAQPTITANFQAGGLVRPEAVGGRGALVLLGEPGAGKTTTFERIVSRNIGQEQDSKIIAVDGADLVDTGDFDSLVGDYIDQTPSPAEGEPSKLTIIIDQLDESPFLSRITKYLERRMLKNPGRVHRILVACRTADYPSGLSVVLRKTLGRCLVTDLSPLTREDVRTLVAQGGLDAESFLSTVSENRLGPLASIPLTLQILADAYRDDPRLLKGSLRQLFQKSTLRLADEHDRRRLQRISITTSANQRVAIAERIAARMIISGQRTIWTGEAAFVGRHDVSDGSLSGGVERVDSGKFEVSPRAVEETLQTALFSRSGENRVAFVHSTFAAFLAAAYLARRGDGEDEFRRQLSGVFLVAAADEDSASIPVHLKETAAWLLEQIGRSGDWLAISDPEGLTAHSAYISSPESRRIIVEGLIGRASEYELANSSWRPNRWQLTYPGLGLQLLSVLNKSLAGGATLWADFARTRLAIQLAEDCHIGEVGDVLLALAEKNDLPITLRQRASRAAMNVAPETAPLRLRTLLASQAVSTSSSEDHNELVGTLLGLLWPTHISLHEVLPHVKVISANSIIGMYQWEIYRFPRQATDHDVPELLEFAEARFFGSDDDPVEFELDDSDAIDNSVGADTTTTFSPASRIPAETVSSIIERALFADDWVNHLGSVARLILRRARLYLETTVPAAVDLQMDSGVESAESRTKRHALLEALVGEVLASNGEFSRREAHLVGGYWKSDESAFGWGADDSSPGFKRRGRARLIDSNDFVPLLGRVDELRTAGRQTLADGLGVLAASFADLYDRESFEVAYSRQGTAEWQQLCWMFNGIRLDDPIVESLRMNVRVDRTWERAEEFALSQEERLTRAESGSSTDFWVLVKFLSLDPTTGRLDYRQSTNDVREFAGAALWPKDLFQKRFLAAAVKYLADESDRRESWLGLPITNFPALAGKLALILACRLGALDRVPKYAWRAWAGSIVDYFEHISDLTDDDVGRTLLDQGLAFARDEILSAFLQYVRTTLAQGRSITAIALTHHLGQHYAPAMTSLADEIGEILQRGVFSESVEVTEAVNSTVTGPSYDLPGTTRARDAGIDTWSTLLVTPLATGHAQAVELAEAALGSSSNRTEQLFSATAARVLVTTQGSQVWPVIYSRIQEDDGLAVNLAHACAEEHHKSAFATALSDTDLESAYLWVAKLVPPETEVYPIGFHSSSPADRLHELRNTLLAILSERDTPEAVLSIRRLSEHYPEDLRIKSKLIDARRRLQAQSVGVITPSQVVKLLDDAQRRVVHTAAQLALLIRDVIEEIARDLLSHSNLLWDCERLDRPAGAGPRSARPEAWRPKPEGALVAYLQSQLVLRLERRGIIINREVLVKPTDSGDSGERPDILVEAAPAVSNSWTTEFVTLRVPIEVKGCWHKDVLIAQRKQLVDRYISHLDTEAGLYIVGYYPIDLWDVQDDRRKWRAKRVGSPTLLRRRLTSQAADIQAECNVRAIPIVIEVPRAQPSNGALDRS